MRIRQYKTITMEFSVCHKNAQYLCYSNPICKTKRPSTLPCQISPRRNVSRTSSGLRNPASSLMQQRVHDHRRSAVVVGCANKGCSTGMAGEIERELEAEMRPEEGAEWLGVGRLRDKCGEGRGGAVELLECLEREAIMGEDEGGLKSSTKVQEFSRLLERVLVMSNIQVSTLKQL